MSLCVSALKTVVKDTDQQLDNMGSNSSAVQNWKGNNVQININVYKTYLVKVYGYKFNCVLFMSRTVNSQWLM